MLWPQYAERVITFETDYAEPRDMIETPRFRVNFWDRPLTEGGWSLDAHVLSDVGDVGDVTEVLRWVEERAHGRRFEVFAEIDDESARDFGTPRKTALVRLLGSNPNAGELTEIARFVKV